MKILYIITGLGLGGAERVVVDLADEMHKQGHQVKIAYLTGDVKVRPRSSKIEVIYLGLENFCTFISASYRYRNLLKVYKPDIVHSHMVHANIFTRLNRIFYHVPRLISSAHSNFEGGRLRMIAYRLTHSLSDITTNVSKNAVKEFEKRKAIPIGGMKTVYNGVDLHKFNTRSNVHSIFGTDEISFISVGRFHDAKDYPNLIRAIFKVKQNTNRKIKFYIAGEGELRYELERLIQELNLKDDIILLGVRADVPDLLNSADFFILPSKYEGLPTVLIEAMACGCFAIATDCGGSAEIMGNTGILVKPSDSEKLAEAILKALTVPKVQIQKNNEKARKYIEKEFSLEQSVNVWMQIYLG